MFKQPFFASLKGFSEEYGRLIALVLWAGMGFFFFVPEWVSEIFRDVYETMDRHGVTKVITQILWCLVFVESVILLGCRFIGEPVSAFFLARRYLWKAHSRVALLIALTWLNVWLNVNIGRVIGEASTILEHRDSHGMDDFYEAFRWFFYYRAGFVFSDFVTHYNARVFAIDWRQAITDIFIPRWARIVGKTKLTGISQRLQEEPYSFAKFFDSMGFQLLHAVLLVYGFSLELQKVSPTVLHIRFSSWIPTINVGVLLVVAVATFAFGLIGAVLLGRKMPHVESYNRDKEAEYRELLVLTEDKKIPFDLETLSASLFLVYRSYLRYFRKVIPLDIWKSVYYNGVAIIPWVMGAHWILETKEITLGNLPPIIYNFEQCMGGLSLFINNWRQIVDFVATKNRLSQLHEAFNARVMYWGEGSPHFPYERFLKNRNGRIVPKVWQKKKKRERA